MIARMCSLAVLLALTGPCESGDSTTDVPERADGAQGAKRGSESTTESTEQADPELLDCEPPLHCSMAGLSCPSTMLTRVDDELDAAGWSTLRALAAERVVALALSPAVATNTAKVVESCRVPGRYLEVVAAPESPGRGWAADRLVLTPDELRDCTGATHFVAAFSVREDPGAEEGGAKRRAAQGQVDPSGNVAIALPLPCPAFGSGEPDYCIGMGLDDDARLELVRGHWTQISTLLRRGDATGIEDALALLVEVAALQPQASNYVNVAKHLRQLDERYGGCLWLSEASFAAHALDPSFESTIDLSQGRIVPSHAALDCAARPSLLTCFPEHFVPGKGDNCW